jgi:hypothetical protein
MNRKTESYGNGGGGGPRIYGKITQVSSTATHKSNMDLEQNIKKI